MCCVAEDLNPRSHILKADKSAYARRYDFWGSEKEANISDTGDNDLNPASNSRGTDCNHRIRYISEMLFFILFETNICMGQYHKIR